MKAYLSPLAALALSIPAAAQYPYVMSSSVGRMPMEISGQPGVAGLPAGWATGAVAPVKVMPQAGMIEAAPSEEDAPVQGSISGKSGQSAYRRVIGERKVVEATVAAIDAAEDSIQFAYPSLLSQPAVVEALRRAIGRGLDANIILDGRRDIPPGAQRLANAGAKIRIPYFSDLDAARFAVFDGRKAEVSIVKERNSPNAGAAFLDDPAYVGPWEQFFKHLTNDAEGAW